MATTVALALLLAASPAASANRTDEPAHLLVRSAAGWVRAEPTARGRTAVLPLVSRSPEVVRPDVGPDGVELATAGPARLEVRAVVHPVDHQVLGLGERLALVGPPELPALAPHVDDPGAVLARLARRDGVAADLAPRDVLPAAGGLALLGRGTLAGEEHARWHELAPAGGSWRGPAGRFDQVLLARIEPLPEGAELAVVASEPAAAPAALGLDGRVVVHRLAPLPPAGEGATVTLLVTVVEGGGALSSPSVDAPAADLVDLELDLVHFEGPDEQLDIRPTMGPGAAVGDLDLDGWLDVYLVQGGGRPGSPPPTNRVLANGTAAGGALRLVDRTDAWGGADDGAGMGALLFDADGDRDLDLFVANYGADVLFENRLGAEGARAPRLVDVSAAAGVGGDLWSAGVCAGDFDLDGDLDLYVTSYLVYDESLMPSMEDLPYLREDPVAMLPFAFPGQRNTLFVNESDARGLRFVDDTERAGVVDEVGRGMQPLAFDFDRDGRLDLYVANDVSPNVLYRGRGDGTFRDVSFQTGMDDPRGGMGVALGDVDLDGDEDLFLTNWELESNALYVSNLLSHSSQRHRVATFRDQIVPSGLGPHGVGVTSWAAVLFDLECDGDLDLFVANGYTSPDYEGTGICVAQPDHLFVNDGRGRYEPAHGRVARHAPSAGRDLPSRCAVEADLDRDGDLDLVLTANNAPYRVLENRTARAGRWLGVRLRAPAPNTYGVGARVEVVTDRRTFVRTLVAGSGYLGGNPPELHFGLGPAERVERVVVHPPGLGADGAGPAAPVVLTPADVPELGLDRWVTLELSGR